MPYTAEYTCPGSRLKCPGGLECIEYDEMCNGFNDCNDKSDEDPDFCRSKNLFAYFMQNACKFEVFKLFYKMYQ